MVRKTKDLDYKINVLINEHEEMKKYRLLTKMKLSNGNGKRIILTTTCVV